MRMIDKDALLSDIERTIGESGCVNHEGEIMDCVRYAPELGAVPVVRGEWKTWEEQFPDRTTRKKNNLGVFCSACQLHADNMTSYCPNCGARMDYVSVIEWLKQPAKED